MSAAVEAAADQPFLTFMREQIFQPLGIGGTKAKISNRATFYEPGWGQDPVFRHGLHVMPARNLSCYAGSLAFFSTPSDLVRFGLAINSGKLLQPATVQLLQTSQQLTSGHETGYGLGWDLETGTLAGKPAQVVGHHNEVLGRRVMSLVMFREAGIVVAVTSNISYADTSALALKVAEAFAQQARGD